MRPDQEAELVSGGDTDLHSHSMDRLITHDQILQFQANESQRIVTSSQTLRYDDDFIFVNTTSGAVSLTLPSARRGKTYTVVRIAGANSVTLNRAGTDTINGGTSLVISTSYAPTRIKAVNGVGWVQI